MIINIMTASLVPGDAIGNYIYTLRRILMEMGFQVRLYADNTEGLYRVLSRPIKAYRSTGHDLLWFHYSIYFSGMDVPQESRDYKIMDFHGVSPSQLFVGYNKWLKHLCELGEEKLPEMVNTFDLCVVHSDYSQGVLEENGCQRPIVKLPLVVDLRRFSGAEDMEMSRLLKQLDYLLFVGRVVPQKGIGDLFRVFAHLRKARPGLKLFLVGGYDFSKKYFNEVQSEMAALGIVEDVVLTGKISAPETLTSFFANARFSMYLSEWESFCVPVIESAYFGTPVIANRVGSLPETVGEIGLLVDKRDHAGVAQAMDALLNDGPCYAAMRARGRAHALRYTEAVLKEEIQALLAREGLR